MMPNVEINRILEMFKMVTVTDTCTDTDSGIQNQVSAVTTGPNLNLVGAVAHTGTLYC